MGAKAISSSILVNQSHYIHPIFLNRDFAISGPDRDNGVAFVGLDLEGHWLFFKRVLYGHFFAGSQRELKGLRLDVHDDCGGQVVLYNKPAMVIHRSFLSSQTPLQFPAVVQPDRLNLDYS